MVNPLLIQGAQATKHAVMRTISVLCVLAIIALLGLGVKRILYPKPTESYAQKAEQITNQEWNYDYSDKDIAFFGLKLWKVRLGITIK